MLSINHYLDQSKNSIQLSNQIRVSIYLCAIQRHIGDGSGAVDISHEYAVKLDALSTTGSNLTYTLFGDSIQTIVSLHSDWKA